MTLLALKTLREGRLSKQANKEKNVVSMETGYQAVPFFFFLCVLLGLGMPRLSGAVCSR